MTYTFSNNINPGNSYLYKDRAINQFSVDNQDLSKYIWSSDLTGYPIDIPNKVENINKLSGEIYWTPLTTTQDFEYDILVNYHLEVSYGNVIYYEVYSGTDYTYIYSVPAYGENYLFRLRVSDTVGYSDYSNILKTTFGSIPDNLNPPILEELNADNRNNKIPYIKVSWSK